MKTIRLIIIIISLSACYSLLGQNIKNCDEFTNLELRDISQENKKIKIYLWANEHLEILNDRGDFIKSTISRDSIDNCKFYLTIKEIRDIENHVPLFVGEKMTMEIKSFENNKIQYSATVREIIIQGEYEITGRLKNIQISH